MFLFTSFFVRAQHDGVVPFTRSFIDGYCFHPESRFSREYHPYLLKKTKESLARLEKYLQIRNFNLSDRLLILGYEQNAVPSYFDCLSQKNIDDEAVTKTESGWEFAVGNVFGFLTGYLFKDTGADQKKLVEHIASDSVELFHDGTEILQRHSFGEWYETIIAYQGGMQACVERSDIGGIFKHLINFWKSIYEAGSKNTQGNRFATQDILFSFYYLKHLAKSSVPISKLFVGPDLTYPIEVAERQSAEVTRNAQRFVERLVKKLEPVGAEKTAYVFWSFVDGVGKSTLLGNVCNWLKYKNDFAKYDHVSNASSQRATLYPVNESVIIADLPAQISHYCAKPDGSVYVDLGFCREMNAKEVQELKQYLVSHYQEILENFEERRDEISLGASPISPEDYMIKNVQTLGAHSFWRPFAFKDRHFVVNVADLRQIRMLVSFDDVHSQGLKIKEPELMIFDKGLSIPMNYDHFMKDLADQLENSGVKNIVFVDFLSMYPRTCRETVRINYLLQQLKSFYQDEFSLDKSVYRSFSHFHELYPLFFDHKNSFERNVFLETLFRWVIYDLIVQASQEDLRSLSAAEVRERLDAKIKELYRGRKDDLNEILSLVRKRIEQEEPIVERYQFSKFYESVSQFSLDRFAQLSEMVRQVVATSHPDADVRELWTQLGEEIDSVTDDGRFVKLANDLKLELVRPLHLYDMDRSIIEALTGEARRTWYSHLIGLVVPELNEAYNSALLLKKNKQGVLCLLRYRYDKRAPQVPGLLEEFQQFGLSPERDNGNPTYVRRWINDLMRTEYSERYGTDARSYFVSLSRLCMNLDEERMWTYCLLEPRDMTLPKPAIISYETVRLVVQALATLHMNLKKPSDDIMVRYGNQDDFIAVLRIFENFMLPKYVSIQLKGSLFSDYLAVEPLVGNLKKKE